VIKASHLHKKYRKAAAVNDISFVIDSGKVTGFLGPNGAGKSTTMRLMLGLDNGTGNTTFDGKKLHEYTQPSKVVGILLEAKAFHPTRTARNHLKILATAGGVPISRVNEVLDIVGLKDVAKKAPGKFSLGMSQRLGIAAAILNKPKYLILDEPANGLDPEGIVWLREFLKSYADEGNAVFVSSHLLSEMSQMADNVIVIGKGELIANTSIKNLVSNNTKSSVFVRSENMSKLKTILKDKSFNFIDMDGGLEITGTKVDEIGKLAYKSEIAVLELTTRNASLEEVFLELTEGKEEYRAHVEKETKS
jgi:ABC-2 type transport system ATP-binding protein